METLPAWPILLGDFLLEASNAKLESLYVDSVAVMLSCSWHHGCCYGLYVHIWVSGGSSEPCAGSRWHPREDKAQIVETETVPSSREDTVENQHKGWKEASDTCSCVWSSLGPSVVVLCPTMVLEWWP